MNILQILSASGQWHDYSKYVQRRGLGWSRNDIDTENTLRTKSGLLRRDKITTKRTCNYTMMPMPQDITAQLDDDLSQSTFTAIYSDLHSTQNRRFYCSSFGATLSEVTSNGDELWEDASFNMIEV